MVRPPRRGRRAAYTRAGPVTITAPDAAPYVAPAYSAPKLAKLTGARRAPKVPPTA